MGSRSPAGCGPSVGIGGLTLGGGVGILGRKHGLTCDHLVGADVVLADGRVVRCDEHHDAELYGALRGAGGGNFGVVVSFVFRTVLPPATTVFRLTWPFVHAAALVEAWQGWAPSGPDELDATLRLTTGDDGGRLSSSSSAPVAATNSTPSSSSTDWSLGPTQIRRLHRIVTWATERRSGTSTSSEPPIFGRVDPFGRAGARPSLQAEVGVLPSTAAVSDDRAALGQNLSTPFGHNESGEVTFTPWGGAYNRVPEDATAFPHRNELFLIQHLLVIDPDAKSEAAREWLTQSWAIVHPHGSGGVYPNFPDLDLEDWARAPTTGGTTTVCSASSRRTTRPILSLRAVAMTELDLRVNGRTAMFTKNPPPDDARPTSAT